MPHLRAKLLFFDIGETLACEDRLWEGWADWLGVPRTSFFAVLGAVIERRHHHTAVFDALRPGIDIAAEREARSRTQAQTGFAVEDLYPDVRPVLAWARAFGLRLGFAGNHPRRTESFVAQFAEPGDLVGSSDRWGVEKPDPGFFRTLADCAGLPPGEIVYVGDRLDNDVLPALAFGMNAIFLARGPWGRVHAGWPEAAEVPWRIETLLDIPGLFGSPVPALSDQPG